MRRPFAALLLLLAVAAPSAAPEPDPVAAALAQARERRVPLLVDFRAPWCYSCYYMARHVLTGAEWERAHRDMVVLELDADSPEGARAMQAWRIKAMPTYLLFDADGREQGRILGEQTRADFYRWLSVTAGRDPLETLKAGVVDGAEASVRAAREVLRAHHARYDAAGGLAWYGGLAPPVRAALARDREAAAWVARLELARAAADKDAAACANVAPMVFASDLGCERPYELDKVMACTAGAPNDARGRLLRSQVERMRLLVDKRVLSDYRCADERSIVLGAADLHQAVGDAPAAAFVLERAIANLKIRIAGTPGSDRNLDDNLRVYLERAGRTDELHAWLVKLIDAYPDDYVYPSRYARSLAARGLHQEAVPHFERAGQKAYGVNRLRNAEALARSLQALGREPDARRVLAETLQANGPWFPAEAARLKTLLDELKNA